MAEMSEVVVPIIAVVVVAVGVGGVLSYFWGGNKENQDQSSAGDEEEQRGLLQGKKTSMTLKNCVKNDSGVVKLTAQQTYEDTFALAVKQGKMTQQRSEELLAKVIRVASNDATVFAGVEHDIRVVRDNDSGDIVIDMVVHFIKEDENESDKLNFSYASCNSTIKNASAAQQAKACELMHRIIENSLSGMKMLNGD